MLAQVKAPVGTIESEPVFASLRPIFVPQSIAVIGASDTESSVGRQLMANLSLGGFEGSIFPINIHRAKVAGLDAFPSVTALPVAADLAIIAVPAESVPKVVTECAQAGVKGAIIISAGFREVGSRGMELERLILRATSGSSMRAIGPNCLGVINPYAHLNATFSQVSAKPGRIAFISQSGALCTAVLDWSLRENIGFSAFVSTGSMLNVGWGDLLDYFAEDRHTESILLYMESAGDDPRSFVSAAREAALKKPIIVIKAGRTARTAAAAISHTGALVGSDGVMDAVFKRCGALRVASIGELFSMAELLGKQPRTRGRRLCIVTNAGGPGVLAADALLAGGGELAPLSAATVATLNQQLPQHWSHGNPIDVLGDAPPERFAGAAQTAVLDPSCDGILLILAPQGMTNPTEAAEEIARSIPRESPKPVLASWMGGDYIAAGRSVLNQHGIATFSFPDSAATAFNLMWQYEETLRTLYETPLQQNGPGIPTRVAEAKAILDSVGVRTVLTEYESKKLIEAYGFPSVPTQLALNNEDEAVSFAKTIGFPVVLKLHSYTLTHKSDVGGVELNLGNEAAVRAAYRRIESTVLQRVGDGHFQGVTVQRMVSNKGYELILGSSIDTQFGPILLFGAGGELVDTFEDHALALPPLTSTLARQVIEGTRISKALQGIRGHAPVDVAALETLLVRLGELVTENPRIKEVDLNPVLASPNGLCVLDARIVVHEVTLADEELPRPAIRPYPALYVSQGELKDGTAIRFRPVRAEDEPLVRVFEKRLSPENIYLRYFGGISLDYRMSHERLVPLCFCDYTRAITLLAIITEANRADAVVGVATLRKLPEPTEAELAFQVADQYQDIGIGNGMMLRMTAIASAENIRKLWMAILPENAAMIHLAEKFGFVLTTKNETVVAKLELAKREKDGPRLAGALPH